MLLYFTIDSLCHILPSQPDAFFEPPKRDVLNVHTTTEDDDDDVTFVKQE